MVVVVAAVVHFTAPTTDQTLPAAVTVHELAMNPTAYDGLRVRASGVARVFSAGGADEHFVVEQGGQDRVGLRGMPSAALTPFVGTPVVVEGVAGFEPGFGAAIRVERIAPLASPSPSS
ncbi:MAG TPA: hypothetical protein VFI22_08640 [Thermomicrobiales bacterium]|nr:hypothetical protein [Thermomicrobiales bacterium]